MQGKLDIRYIFPDNAKVKNRFSVPEGVDFTKVCRAAIESTVLEVLNTNVLTVRAMIEKKIKGQGLTLKKEAYQAHLDADNKNMLRCMFGTKESIADAAAAGVDTEVDVKPVDEVPDNDSSVGQTPTDQSRPAEETEEVPKPADPDFE